MAVMVWAAAAQAQDFLEGLEDVPLMPGLATVQGAGGITLHDPPAGCVEHHARILDRGQVVGFYAETLPALGWTASSEVRYVREGEVLVLDLFGPDRDLLVRFTLAPE